MELINPLLSKIDFRHKHGCNICTYTRNNAIVLSRLFKMLSRYPWLCIIEITKMSFQSILCEFLYFVSLKYLGTSGGGGGSVSHNFLPANQKRNNMWMTLCLFSMYILSKLWIIIQTVILVKHLAVKKQVYSRKPCSIPSCQVCVILKLKRKSRTGLT